MSRSFNKAPEVPSGINDFFESLKSVSKSQFFKALEDEEEQFSPFPHEDFLNEEDVRSLEMSFNEHNKIKPQLEDLLKMLSDNSCGCDCEEHSNVSLKMKPGDKDKIIDNLQKAQSDVESIQGQLSDMLSKGFFNEELENHAKILHNLSISAVADLLPKDVQEVLKKGETQFQKITEVSDQKNNQIKPTSEENIKLPPIADLKIDKEDKPLKKHFQRKSKSKAKKPSQQHQVPAKKNNQHLPEYLPYEPDECILCEYYHVFGKYPINLMKAYDKRLKEETAKKNEMEMRNRRKKRHQRKK